MSLTYLRLNTLLPVLFLILYFSSVFFVERIESFAEAIEMTPYLVVQNLLLLSATSYFLFYYKKDTSIFVNNFTKIIYKISVLVLLILFLGSFFYLLINPAHNNISEAYEEVWSTAIKFGSIAIFFNGFFVFIGLSKLRPLKKMTALGILFFLYMILGYLEISSGIGYLPENLYWDL